MAVGCIEFRRLAQGSTLPDLRFSQPQRAIESRLLVTLCRGPGCKCVAPALEERHDDVEAAGQAERIHPDTRAQGSATDVGRQDGRRDLLARIGGALPGWLPGFCSAARIIPTEARAGLWVPGNTALSGRSGWRVRMSAAAGESEDVCSSWRE